MVMKVLLLAMSSVTMLQAQEVPLTGRRLPREQEVRLAASAAPQSVGAAAGVYVYGASGYERVRESTNGFTCLVNRDSFLAGYHVLKPTCWDAEGSATIVPQILHIGKRLAANVPAGRIRAELDSLFDAGALKFPEGSGLAYMLQGDVAKYDTVNARIVERVFPPHLMIYAPGAQQDKLGMPSGAASKDMQAPLVYSPNRRFSYIVVRVPPQ